MQYLAKGEIKKYFILGIVASLFHISGFLVVLITYSLFTKQYKVILIAVASSIVMIYFLDEYLLSKLAGYEAMSSPSKFSGVSTLIMSISFLLIWLKYGYLRTSSTRVIFYSFVYTFSSYLLVFVSYAGLRIQTLVFLSILCAFLIHIHRNNIQIKLSTRLYFVIVGLIGFMFKVKIFYESYGVGESPFLPYSFIWS